MTPPSSRFTGISPSVRFDPRKFYGQARRMAQAKAEVSLRSAISRAYYSLYHIGCERANVQAEMLRSQRGKEGSHEYFIRIIGNLTDTTTAGQLHKLKGLRVLADYELCPSTSRQRSMQLIGDDWRKNWNDAERLVNALLPILTSL